jgi:hypothetical protein
MAIRRRHGPPRVVLSGIEGCDSLYEVQLTAAPSPAWRAAFVRLPGRLTRERYTPDVGRVVVRSGRVVFRTAPVELDGWLRRIDRWIAYANAIVESDPSGTGRGGL